MILCCPNVLRSPVVDNKLYSLGLLYLRNAARQAGYESILVDAYFLELTVEETVKRILCEDNPFLYGFMINSPEMLKSALSIIQRLPRDDYKGGRVPVVLGGIYPSLEYRGLMEANDEIDLVVRGEGEETFRHVLEALRDSKGFGGIPGLSWRTGSKICHNSDRQPASDLDVFGDYDPGTISGVMPEMSWTISSSRGCSGACSFCLVGLNFGKKGVWRGHSAQWVADHVEEMTGKYGARHIRFVDDEFVGCERSADRAMEITELLKKRKVRPKFSIMCRSDTVRRYPAVFKKLRSAGLANVFLGIESGNDEVLSRLNKRHSVEDSMKAVSILCDLNVRVQGGNIVFHPWMSEETALKDIGFFQDLLERHDKFVFFTLNGVDIFRDAGLGEGYKGKGGNWQFKWEAQDEKMQAIYALWMRIERTILFPALASLGTITPRIRRDLCFWQLKAFKGLITGFKDDKRYREGILFEIFLEICGFLRMHGGRKAMKSFLARRTSTPEMEKEVCFERHY